MVRCRVSRDVPEGTTQRLWGPVLPTREGRDLGAPRDVRRESVMVKDETEYRYVDEEVPSTTRFTTPQWSLSVLSTTDLVDSIENTPI